MFEDEVDQARPANGAVARACESLALTERPEPCAPQQQGCHVGVWDPSGQRLQPWLPISP